MRLRVHLRGGGPPLLVLPPFSVSHKVMATVIEPAVSDAGSCRRIYVDLPGTGESPPTATSSEAVLESILESVDPHLGDEPFAVAGWSYGGYLALGIARRQPERVLGLLAVCAAPKIRPEDRDLTGALASECEENWLADVPGDLHDHFRTAVGIQTRKVARRICTALALNGPTDEAYLSELRRDGFALTDEGSPVGYGGPACFLAGRHDRVAGFIATFSALERYPGADFGLFSRAGHYLPIEEPGRFEAEALSWLRRCGLARPDKAGS